MTKFLGISIIIFSLFAASFSVKKSKPNIIFILADDLGYGEVGFTGQKIIETPNIDALAKNGMIFNEHYTGAPVCAPARCTLLTGKHTGNAYIRGNDEWASRGDVWNLKAMNENPKLEGQFPMPDSTFTVAELFKSAGYTTALIGKWGLGAPETESTPNKQGFDFFYGYNCQRQAHTLYPTHLWKNEERVSLNNKFVDIHQKLDPSLDAQNPENYKDFELNDYAPEMMHREALKFLSEQKNKPFFLFYASPLPHVPLQAPKKWVEYYQKKLGKEEPYTGNKGNIYYPNRTPRATYAAMISYLDEQVGDLVKKLKETNQYENTLIIFTSDNGPSYAGGTQPEYFKSGGPYQEQFGRGKGFVYEGGIHVPMIASWQNTIQKGSKNSHISSFYDFMATVSDLVKVKTIENDGISYLPTLMGKKQKPHEYLYWEFPETGGQQAIRMGKWKAVRSNLHKGKIETQLYDLEKDKQELVDLSKQHPEIIAKLEVIFKKEHTKPLNEKFGIKVLGD
jgi:arylsulfatase A-like enzyme